MAGASWRQVSWAFYGFLQCRGKVRNHHDSEHFGMNLRPRVQSGSGTFLTKILRVSSQHVFGCPMTLSEEYTSTGIFASVRALHKWRQHHSIMRRFTSKSAHLFSFGDKKTIFSADVILGTWLQLNEKPSVNSAGFDFLFFFSRICDALRVTHGGQLRTVLSEHVHSNWQQQINFFFLRAPICEHVRVLCERGLGCSEYLTFFWEEKIVF